MPDWMYNLEVARLEYMHNHPVVYWLCVAGAALLCLFAQSAAERHFRK